MVIYRDALGRPESCANVWTSGADYGYKTIIDGKEQPSRKKYVFTSTSDAPVREWPGDTSAEKIIAELSADGWECIASRDGHNDLRISCTHRDTQRIIDARQTAMQAEFDGAERGYIRFGKCPKSGKSHNYRDNIDEIGTSVFEAEFAASGKYRLLLTPALELSYLMVMQRDAYRIYGERIGTGADGEPLLKVDKADKT